MKEDNVDNIWTEKMRMAEALLESVNILSKRLMRPERSGRIAPIIVETFEGRREQLILTRMACHFLCAMVFELAIKIIWEVEKQKKKCNPHHRISEYYEDLSLERQSHIRRLYERQANLIRREIYTDAAGRDYRIEFQSLEEALEANPDTVKNFKYDGKLRGKSSVISGVMWIDDEGSDDKTSWVFPDNYIIFPKEIMKYVRECVGAQP